MYFIVLTKKSKKKKKIIRKIVNARTTKNWKFQSGKGKKMLSYSNKLKVFTSFLKC
jgi:hypothetical protein